ncbi:hypothetical protein [Nocardia cyriacigeorgica]|uniref:Uncharacterized protein n=1 Tax=Nocardia cyriacigeorgica TaxID=135487 RepID=A0A5R8N839_9NOCA|nr:hypothetical protein [Nocardia cyriacigeorgica]TLF71862.1 hypothetical protein FEK34_29755 [Nocardia cyriacigeorgica]
MTSSSAGGARWRPWAGRAIGLCVLIAGGLYGCGRAADHAVDRMMVVDAEESVRPELIREATEYGGWVLPDGAEVLLVQREIIRDRNYRIAVTTNPADLALMLEHSRFPAVLTRDYPPFTIKTIAGPPLESSPRVEHGQEAWFTSSSGKVMIREVTVDVRDADTRFVHIEFRGV